MANYQPNFFDPDPSHRQHHDERLAMIRRELGHREETLLDIGCSQGYFSFGLMDIFETVLAVDVEPQNIDYCTQLKAEHCPKSRLFFNHFDVTRMGLGGGFENDPLQHDCILYMGVHHHVVEQAGWAAAKTTFNNIASWLRPGGCLFFEMGQKDEQGCEKHTWWQMLPRIKQGAAVSWIKNYVQMNTRFTNCTPLGHTPIHGAKRWLFKLK